MKYYIDFSSEQTLKEAIVNKLKHEFGKNVDEASPELIYKACALVIRDRLLAQIAETNKKDINNKKLYYLSMEFLAGRSLANNIINLIKPIHLIMCLRNLALISSKFYIMNRKLDWAAVA